MGQMASCRGEEIGRWGCIDVDGVVPSGWDGMPVGDLVTGGSGIYVGFVAPGGLKTSVKNI